ncbi:uncharacterized protein BXIN_0881 [Babesia sp. Xinjiang]|uniref:uncharacterized protein n=1 Tax=Babesia sp. Xinjiang TaxID=462227 RepID=UPI000A24A4DB|nr:uncharacterized protein BXIN_0881 [Babesia sp. Xinjiang]ORM41220.1 hypothetical protein BXIN_0881 [Babesia sp. Xinjiang]
MAYITPPGSIITPIPPTTNLFPEKSQGSGLVVNCPGGVCSTAFYDKVLRYTPQGDSSPLRAYLRWIPTIIIFVLVLIIIAWIPRLIKNRYRAYEDALEQRLVDAMGNEEKEVYA